MAENNTEKQRVQELTDKLEQGLQDLFNSDSYCNYLRTMSKFHNYSFNNTLLIAMQKPDATLVAGYKAWQKNFERHVNKGEKAIRILAPAPYKIKEERDKIDPVTQELLLDKDGNPQKEEVEITIPAFRAVSVFDVAQTDGKPIPELAAKELLSDVEGYQDMIRAVEAISPVPIELEEIAGDSKGYYDREAKRIAVQENMSESQTLKTMIHEVVHSKLHSKEVEQDEQMKKDRNTKEVEAESIAYTVCQHFGIDTSDYSFGYIAGWSSGRDTKELRSSMDTIRRTASELITGIEEQLQELQRNREVSQEQTKESILLMHECDEGYDYSILNEQYHLLDGGVYDNPDITIQRAMDMVIADLKEPRFSAVTEQYYRDEFLQGEVYAGSEAEIVDFEELSEKAEEVEQADLEAKQAEFRENNPDVVADFRAKTEELFHSLDGQSADDIEKMVYAYVQSQIDEYGLDAEIVDVVVAGSRCRGIEKENSDLDVVVEYIGSTREDDLFNLLHEDSIYIAGIQVDINPITEGKTGTLETYLPEVETYLQEKAQQEQINNQLVTQGREVVQEQNALASEEKVLSELEKEPMVEPETVHITFTVAECGEFHNMGEYHEGIETIEEAMKLYNAIDPSRMHGIPSIGVNMHIEGTEEWEDEEADIVRGNCIDVDFLNYTPELRDTPTVQDALKKLIAAYPEKEVNDRETKETKIQTLAAELDQLSYDIDTFEYRDLVPDREAQVQMIANDIRSGNVKPLQIFLQTSIDGGIDEDSERQAKELIAKLAEYKPLAKIEELEEQNYNMIDDRLNNGVEKFNREEEKKEQQEKPQARSSLKERLVAKQKEVAQGKNKDAKEQDKTKKTYREEI